MNNPPAKLSQDITFDWSPDLVRICSRRYILRGSRRTQLLLLLLLAAGIFCVVKGIIAGWVLIGFFALLASKLFRLYLRSIKLAEQRSDRKVTVRVEPERITFNTSHQESALNWSQIREAWSSPDVLMLFPEGGSQYIALPVASLGEDLRQFIETNIRQNGGRIS